MAMGDGRRIHIDTAGHVDAGRIEEQVGLCDPGIGAFAGLVGTCQNRNVALYIGFREGNAARLGKRIRIGRGSGGGIHLDRTVDRDRTGIDGQVGVGDGIGSVGAVLMGPRRIMDEGMRSRMGMELEDAP